MTQRRTGGVPTDELTWWREDTGCPRAGRSARQSQRLRRQRRCSACTELQVPVLQDSRCRSKSGIGNWRREGFERRRNRLIPERVRFAANFGTLKVTRRNPRSNQHALPTQASLGSAQTIDDQIACRKSGPGVLQVPPFRQIVCPNSHTRAEASHLAGLFNVSTSGRHPRCITRRLDLLSGATACVSNALGSVCTPEWRDNVLRNTRPPEAAARVVSRK